MKELLREVAARSTAYLNQVETRAVAATPEAVARLEALGGPLPQHGSDPIDVMRLLDDVAAPATVACAGGRYFGFVTGGALPAALAANWLAGAWDQNAFSTVSSPLGAALECITLGWLIDLLHLPAGGGAFVTGATMANFTALAAARHTVLTKTGWDVEEQGLFGAPEVTVVVGEEAHATLFKALGLLGLGRKRVMRVAVDDQGRMQPSMFPTIAGPTIVCLQAGNVNTGAFDPAPEICRLAHDAGAWVHVDGAFGLWAAVAPARAGLVQGFEQADSWAVDAHKWLNVPYDSGFAFVRDPQALRAAMSINAAYLPDAGQRNPFNFTPESSRRMRGAEVWAALKSLGRQGIADLVERNCRHAQRFADGLRAGGYEVLNDVVLNQVLVSFGPEEITRHIVEAVQADGTCWCGATVWQDHAAMRISVCSWATTDRDVEESLAAILRIADEQQRHR